MLACRKWGQRQIGYYYLSSPIRVLLQRANDLRFGARRKIERNLCTGFPAFSRVLDQRPSRSGK